MHAGDVADWIAVLGKTLALVVSGDRSLDAKFAAARQRRCRIARSHRESSTSIAVAVTECTTMHVPFSPYKGIYLIRQFSL